MQPSIIKRIYHYRPSLLLAFALLIFIPPLLLLNQSFLIAMTWRFLDGVPYYKAGHVITAILNIITIGAGLLLLRLNWNASIKLRRPVRFLTLALAASTLMVYINAPGFIPPLRKVLNEFHGKVFYMETVTAESFVVLKHKLENSLLPPRKLYVGSGGGDGYAGLAIGELVYAYQLDVHVEDLCASSCANYIFPAGKRKTLGHSAIVMYHGNTLQKNHVNFLRELEKVKGDVTQLPKNLDLGRKGKEASITLPTSQEYILSEAEKKVRSYLGWAHDLDFLETTKAFTKTEAAFYKKMGIDHKIGIYGQIDNYEEIYNDYQYDGFYYSLVDMKKMGLQNIRVSGGTWTPELNTNFANYYLVKTDTKGVDIDEEAAP